MPDLNEDIVFYTTGELAKLCGVSVRTVQYYDTRGLLIPSELSEGGRRLYSKNDVKLLKTICFLRDAGLPINSIGELLREDAPENVISALLDEHEKAIKKEIVDREKQIKRIDGIRRGLKSVEHFSVESIGDIAHIMENKKRLRQVHLFMILAGLPLTALELVGIIFGITNGFWWLFATYIVLGIPYGILISRYYFKQVSYICPNCHTVFKPRFKEAFWARHTPAARKLTCTSCTHSGFCVETITE